MTLWWSFVVGLNGCLVFGMAAVLEGDCLVFRERFVGRIDVDVDVQCGF